MANRQLTANKEVRDSLAAHNIPQWQLADALGIHEETLCRRLRRELPDDEKAKLLEVIEKIKGATA